MKTSLARDVLRVLLLLAGLIPAVHHATTNDFNFLRLYAGAGIEFSLAAEPDASYTMNCTYTLTPPDWQTLTSAQRFYRLSIS